MNPSQGRTGGGGLEEEDWRRRRTGGGGLEEEDWRRRTGGGLEEEEEEEDWADLNVLVIMGFTV